MAISRHWNRRAHQRWGQRLFGWSSVPSEGLGNGTEDRNETPVRRQEAIVTGTEVACGIHHRLGPHAEGTTQGRSGIPWAKKWPSKRLLQSVAGQTRRLHPVERVEKATDNRSARSLCYRKWLTLIPKSDRPVVGPGALRHTPPALGPTTIATESPYFHNEQARRGTTKGAR